MIQKPFDEIAKEDIEALIANEVREDRQIEYKSDVPGGTDDEKKEFLADVSCFGNAAGGDLVLGVTEKEGIPTDAPGLSGDVDAAILRVESMIRDGLDPRISGIRTKPIPGFRQGPVLLVRIPRSWSGPHIIKFKDWCRFYTRSSNGKHIMDVKEIRAAFEATGTTRDKILRFRRERVASIAKGELPVPLFANPKTILHIEPMAAFQLESQLSASDMEAYVDEFLPINPGKDLDYRFNIDGLLVRTPHNADLQGSRGYTQVFRSGIIEAVDSDLMTPEGNTKLLHITPYEKAIIEATERYLEALVSMDVSPPVVLALSIHKANGFAIYAGPSRTQNVKAPIDRAILLLPHTIVEDLSCVAAAALRPVFDALWNAAGYVRSMNYDRKGKWHNYAM